ncbi:MAG: type II toxin-antitoxin system VapC family toxin [Propionibacteriaceae bacterium]|jgi:predicted nucleic acid-binding protein|nr:type II toxin-antitoxin system VapC family toxin [Propionibacteriaceae bacterium]
MSSSPAADEAPPRRPSDGAAPHADQDGENGGWAVDTSVAVAYLDADHTAHEACVAAVGGRRAALAGHAAFEAYSVLTRLPEPNRVACADAWQGLEAAFPERCWLAPEELDTLVRRLAQLGVIGGAVFDALVGEAARAADRTLLTRDRRARGTYDLLGVRYRLVE